MVVTLSRTLSLADYRSANELTLRNGTFQHRLTFWLFQRYFPVLAVPLGAWALYKEVLTILSGDSPTGFAILFAFSVTMALQPLALRNRIKKLRHAQGLDRQWTIEVSDEGIHSIVEGLSDSKLSWDYFNEVVEDSKLFLFINAKRGAFIAFPKADITPEALEELRSFGSRHIKFSGPRDTP